MSDEREIEVIEYENGTYIGEVINGIREGKGKFHMDNGAVAYGDWVDDFMNGEGIYRGVNGEVIYEGNFVNGDMEGDGVLKTQNGDEFEGVFKDGKLNGKGIIRNSAGKVYYEGEFLDNKMHGFGILTLLEDNERYEGEFIDGSPYGNATYYFSNGDRQEGYFVDGRMVKGKEYRTNGEIISIDYTEDKEMEEDNSFEEENKEELRELLEELNSYVGLESVKENVNTLINLINMQKLRAKAGLKVIPMTSHLVFTGNPGTGKTTIARLISKIYKSMGLLKEGHFIETDRSELVAEYVGQTSIKVTEKVKEALGGVLFIDEAYTLFKESGGDFGQEAIDTLLKLMEDNRDNLVVIVAGYENEMRKFLNSNPGLKSRFKEFIKFEDYDAEELTQIFDGLCEKNQFILSKEASESIKLIFEDAVNNKKENFSNGRFVRNLFEDIIKIQANRLMKSNDIDFNSIEEMQMIILEDIEKLS